MRVSVKNSLVGALTVVMDEPLLESPPTIFINVSPLGTPTGVEKFIFYHSNRCWCLHQQLFVSTNTLIEVPTEVYGLLLFLFLQKTFNNIGPLVGTPTGGIILFPGNRPRFADKA